MDHQQLIDLARSQLARHEITYIDDQSTSLCGSIGLNQLLDILESKEYVDVSDEEKPQFLMTEISPPVDIAIRVFYINFHGVKLNDIMHVLPEYDINDFRVKDEDGFHGLGYGWSHATDDEINEYNISQMSN